MGNFIMSKLMALVRLAHAIGMVVVSSSILGQGKGPPGAVAAGIAAIRYLFFFRHR